MKEEKEKKELISLRLEPENREWFRAYVIKEFGTIQAQSHAFNRLIEEKRHSLEPKHSRTFQAKERGLKLLEPIFYSLRQLIWDSGRESPIISQKELEKEIMHTRNVKDRRTITADVRYLESIGFVKMTQSGSKKYGTPRLYEVDFSVVPEMRLKK